MLGLATGHTIWLDVNAAGWSWFVDPTPKDDGDFTTADTGRFQNATGTEHMELDQNFATGAFTFTLDGTVSSGGTVLQADAVKSYWPRHWHKEF